MAFTKEQKREYYRKNRVRLLAEMKAARKRPVTMDDALRLFQRQLKREAAGGPSTAR